MNTDKRRDKAAAKERVRRRINADFDRSKYKYIPEEKPIDFYDNDVEQRVGIYVRVSTDDIRQTTSYELQKKYYEDFVQKHPHWKLVKIYADATDIIGLKQNPTNGRRFSPIFHLSGIFRYKTRKCYF